jgi:hypothetical protein
MSPFKILNLDLGNLSKYLVKPWFGIFSRISADRSLRLTLEGANGRQGSGLTKAELDRRYCKKWELFLSMFHSSVMFIF